MPRRLNGRCEQGKVLHLLIFLIKGRMSIYNLNVCTLNMVAQKADATLSLNFLKNSVVLG